jgi:hypothetical protein
MLSSTRLRAGLLAGILAGACKPPTEEEKFERALARADIDEIRAHLDAGKSPTAVLDDGNQPLHIVAMSHSGSVEAVALLVERGAEISATNADGKTPWDLAWGDPRRWLPAAETEVLLGLLDAGFIPPTPTLPQGRTLLHAVAERASSVRLVSVIVDKLGLPVDARDEAGWTPLHVAVHEHRVESATALLEKGADPNAETTAVVGQSRDRDDPTAWNWRYDVGSRPLDVYRPASRGRTGPDIRKVLEQYGATSNPAVKNKPR